MPYRSFPPPYWGPPTQPNSLWISKSTVLAWWRLCSSTNSCTTPRWAVVAAVVIHTQHLAASSIWLRRCPQHSPRGETPLDEVSIKCKSDLWCLTLSLTKVLPGQGEEVTEGVGDVLLPIVGRERRTWGVSRGALAFMGGGRASVSVSSLPHAGRRCKLQPHAGKARAGAVHHIVVNVDVLNGHVSLGAQW